MKRFVAIVLVLSLVISTSFMSSSLACDEKNSNDKKSSINYDKPLNIKVKEAEPKVFVDIKVEEKTDLKSSEKKIKQEQTMMMVFMTFMMNIFDKIFSTLYKEINLVNKHDITRL